jgi:flagellum-specific peptidoglycan hydrolase FlgJ
MKETVKKTLKYLGLCVAIIVITITTAIVTHNKIYSDCGLTDYNYMIYRDRTELALDGCRDAIVTEIDHYIDSIAPDSGLNGIKLFELCDAYDIDVRFAMAQAEAESHFGTKGMAAKTNVVWNVRAYDDTTAEEMKRKGHDAQHPDMSIEPYLKLLVTSYFVDGKNELDMFDNFVDVNGKRYASNPNYENLVEGIYNRINECTDLDRLLKEYRKYQKKLLYGV